MLRRRRVLKILVGAGALFLALVLLAWGIPQQLLTLDDGSVQADSLVVLGGGAWERPRRAAELFKAQAASRILVSGQGDCEANRERLIESGVPLGAIEVEDKSRNTKENALYSIALLREFSARRVIIVTLWYHSRRALRTFQHYAPDIQFYSRPSYYGYSRKRQGAERKAIRGSIRAEYAKLLGYRVRYGMSPF